MQSDEFSPVTTPGQLMLLGSYTGEVKVYNVASGVEEWTQPCHSSAINHLQMSHDNSLLLTCSDFVRPMSAVWRVTGESLVSL